VAAIAELAGQLSGLLDCPSANWIKLPPGVERTAPGPGVRRKVLGAHRAARTLAERNGGLTRVMAEVVSAIRL